MNGKRRLPNFRRTVVYSVRRTLLLGVFALAFHISFADESRPIRSAFDSPGQWTRWLKVAAGAGHVASQNVVAWRNLDGEGAAPDFSVAVNWSRRAVQDNHENVQNALGFLLHRGKGPRKI